MDDGQLFRIEIADESGIFSARRVGREVAAAVRMERQDQVRVATALSEAGRDLYLHSGLVTVAFHTRGQELVIELGVAHQAADRTLPELGLAAAARLMDRVDYDLDPGRATIRMCKRLPSSRPPVAEVRDRLAALLPVSALDELRVQNAELMQTLEEVRLQREEMAALNVELEETNRGVLALYNQLSEELEETNRGVVALYSELDDRAAQIREAGEVRNRFWANISHELRTPVNSMIGLARLLLGKGGDPLTPDQAHQIELIAASAGSLLTLVNELLDMAKAERGSLEASFAEVDVAAVLTDLAGSLRPMAEVSGITLTVDAVQARVITDAEMITRIVRNLLGNALRFTETGGVTLTVAVPDDHLVCTVSDTGPGIPEEHRQRVFEEFYQVPGVTGGTGLGLPYARRLTDLLGGSLELSSELGRGTEVTVRLPVIRLSLGHVLIVDDEREVRSRLRELMLGTADRISEVSGGNGALALAAADPPDLVLLDLQMPDGDGFEVLGRLDPAIPVVVVTVVDVSGMSDPRLSRAGAAILKSRLDRATLLAAVHKAMQRSG